MKIVIETETVETRSGNTNGRSWEIHSQPCRVMSNYIRGPSQITLLDPKKPYPAGEYEMDLEKNVQLGRFGRIEFIRTPTLDRIISNETGFIKNVANMK
jgi:hypothetical protein